MTDREPVGQMLTYIADTLNKMAEQKLRDLMHPRPQEPKQIRIDDIQRVVARQYNISRADLLSSRRTAEIVRPRQIAMYLAKTLTRRSLPEIGRRFGGRDHTTVLHAVRKIDALAAKDMTLSEEMSDICEILSAPWMQNE
jgi:chromosomal replication initiator protein